MVEDKYIRAQMANYLGRVVGINVSKAELTALSGGFSRPILSFVWPNILVLEFKDPKGQVLLTRAQEIDVAGRSKPTTLLNQVSKVIWIILGLENEVKATESVKSYRRSITHFCDCVERVSIFGVSGISEVFDQVFSEILADERAKFCLTNLYQMSVLMEKEKLFATWLDTKLPTIIDNDFEHVKPDRKALRSVLKVLSLDFSAFKKIKSGLVSRDVLNSTEKHDFALSLLLGVAKNVSDLQEFTEFVESVEKRSEIKLGIFFEKL